MERFYIETELLLHASLSLSGDEHHHLSHVMRLTHEEEIELINGRGVLARAQILHVGKKETSLQIIHLSQKEAPHPPVSLGIPLMRPSKLEWVIEKGTEIGASAFFLYPADHSTQKALSEHQMGRLQAIAISAIKQSKRLYLPQIEIAPHLSSLLGNESLVFFGDLSPEAATWQEETLPLRFITGPEKGFSDKEKELLKKHGKGVRINPNILRAETAPLVALSLMCLKQRI